MWSQCYHSMGASLRAATAEATAARGIAVGVSSHSIGTAALMTNEEEEAASVSSVALCVAGTVHAIALATPAGRRALHRCAGTPGA